MHVVRDKYLSYNCAYILNSEVIVLSQVYASHPVGGQVQGCVHHMV